MAGFVRLDLDIYRGSTHCTRWGDVSLCLVAEIRAVDADFRTGAVVGEPGIRFGFMIVFYLLVLYIGANYK